jgi:signal-transduction protein with cAMP-binding, CBS, and nucleotidyltransferase domain
MTMPDAAPDSDDRPPSKEAIMPSTDLSTIPLCETVPHAYRTEIANITDRYAAPEGDVLVRQGELAHEFFIILDGVAEVVSDARSLTALGPGDFFGEIGLIGRPFRTATVVARSDLDLALVPRREFRAMLSRYPDLASTILSTGRRRIASTPSLQGFCPPHHRRRVDHTAVAPR